jgi:hypothetical protein
LKKGHPNIIKAFNAKVLDPLVHLHSGEDFSNLLDKSKYGQLYKSDDLSMGYIRLEYCAGDDLFAYVKCGATRLNERLCHAFFV